MVVKLKEVERLRSVRECEQEIEWEIACWSNSLLNCKTDTRVILIQTVVDSLPCHC